MATGTDGTVTNAELASAMPVLISLARAISHTSNQMLKVQKANGKLLKTIVTNLSAGKRKSGPVEVTAEVCGW